MLQKSQLKGQPRENWMLTVSYASQVRQLPEGHGGLADIGELGGRVDALRRVRPPGRPGTAAA